MLCTATIHARVVPAIVECIACPERDEHLPFGMSHRRTNAAIPGDVRAGVYTTWRYDARQHWGGRLTDHHSV
jgi:hypothetical protein